jgi:hypothetical protein
MRKKKTVAAYLERVGPLIGIMLALSCRDAAAKTERRFRFVDFALRRNKLKRCAADLLFAAESTRVEGEQPEASRGPTIGASSFI